MHVVNVVSTILNGTIKSVKWDTSSMKKMQRGEIDFFSLLNILFFFAFVCLASLSNAKFACVELIACIVSLHPLLPDITGIYRKFLFTCTPCSALVIFSYESGSQVWVLFVVNRSVQFRFPH
jgi:hypothetical protein